jgi:hypothetical protein
MPPPTQNCQNCLTPTMINSDSIEISEVKKSTVSHTANLSNQQYENFILYNLIKNNSPNDVSINTYSIPSGLDTNDTNLTIQRNDPGNLIPHTIINNNDKYVQSEKFALDVKYSDNQRTTNIIRANPILGPTSITVPSNIILTDKTISYYNSTLKIDVSLNNEPQLTDGDEPWSVTYDRDLHSMNYFAAINSHLNTSEASNHVDKYPFRIYEDITTNIHSLGVDGIYFTQNDNDQRVAHYFADDDLENTTLAVNNLELSRNNYTDFNSEDFGTYKIEQLLPDDSNIETSITSTNGGDVSDITDLFPIGDENGDDITTDLIDFEDVTTFVDTLESGNSSKISSGFTATLNVSVGGEYSCNENNKFSINDTSLTVSGSDENLNYFTNDKSNNRHYVDISNGSVTLDANNANVSAGYITLSNGAETLETTYHTTSGEVVIEPTTTNARADITDGTLASEINVYYNTVEGSTYISNNLRVAGDVSYDVKLLVESTSNTANETYDNTDDKRNLVPNTANTDLTVDSVDSRLVIANDNTPVNFDIRSQTNFKFFDADTNNKIRNSGKINILNIENKNILVQDGPLYSKLTEEGEITEIPGTSCDVALVNTPLNNMPYTDYRIKLVTKNATDISNTTAPTNGWTFALTHLQNDSLGLPSTTVWDTILGDSNHRSEIIPDVFSFLHGNTPLNIQYKLIVEPTASSLNYIKYKFDVLSNGSTYSFGYNDTQFEIENDMIDTKLADVLSTSVTGNGLDPSLYIFERWLRKKQYKATLDPNLPFYKNLLLKTPVLKEENVYYRAWKKSGNGKGNEISPVNLQSFTLTGETDKMNTVNVRLVESFGSTTATGTTSQSVDSTIANSPLICNIVLNPNDCGIFKTKLQGKDLTNNIWNDLGVDAHIDPFIKQTGTIQNYDTNNITGAFSCEVRVAFPLDEIVKESLYYIDITNPLNDSANLIITANLYSFNTEDIANNPNLIDAFSPYKSTFTDSVIASYKTATNYVCDLTLNSNIYKLTISHLVSGVSKKDVEIDFPKDYVLNFNIINSAKNLFSVYRTIDSVTNFLGYKFETTEGNTNDRIFKVEDGVYLTLVNNVVAGMGSTFSLLKDEVKVNFVNHNGYTQQPNADWKNNWQTIVLDSNNTKTVSNNGTRSVIFHQTRGYNVTGTNKNISINRTATQYRFVLDASNAAISGSERTNGTENQIYEQIWNGGVTNNTNIFKIDTLKSTSTADGLWNTNVTANDDKVYLDIGLLLNIHQSILAETDTVRLYEIIPSAASYNYTFANTLNTPAITNGTGSGSLFDGTLTKFFNFKIRSLKVTYPIQIKLEYVSSRIVISFINNYKVNPSTASGWRTLRTLDAIDTAVGKDMSLDVNTSRNATSAYHISLKRTAEKTGQFTSYFVCAPPSFGIEFNALDADIRTLPFSQSGRTRTTVHVDALSRTQTYNLRSYVADSKVGENTNISSPTLNLQNLRTSTNANRQNLIVKGNNLKISIYNGINVPDSSTAPIGASINNGIEYDGLINEIVNAPPRNANKFRANLIGNGYDISYSQPLTGIAENLNDSFNINFTISNAFLPASTSYLPLAINKSSRVTLYDSRFHYGYNGKYYLILHKYDSEDGGVDYNTLLAANSNIRQVSFRLDRKSQKSIELYMLDNSGNRALVNPINLSDASNINHLLDNLNVNDLSGNWSETSITVESAGVSLAALDYAGMNGIRNLLQYNPSDRLSNKTLFIKRADIFRVYSSVGSPVLRITNSGNIITPKVTTSMVSLLQQSVVTGSRDVTYGTEAISTGLFSEGALDFSGNWLQ